jgi:hypothetical protein
MPISYIWIDLKTGDCHRFFVVFGGWMSIQNGLFSDELPQVFDIPPLEYGPVPFAIGRLYCQLKPGGMVQAEMAGECYISPRIKEPVYNLPTGEKIVVTTRRIIRRPNSIDGILFRDYAGNLKWQHHIEIEKFEADTVTRGWPDVIRKHAAGWERRLFFQAERPNNDGSVDPGKEGLRPPQVGALHAIGAHWSLFHHPATVVMPTGTGKTETMLATLAAFIRGGPLLVTVPSAVLRDQTAVKFRTFGLLRKLGVLMQEASNPAVGIVTRRPRSIEDLDIFMSCNVIVGTMSALAQGEAVPFAPEIAARVDTLIADEAHHIGADKWLQRSSAKRSKIAASFSSRQHRSAEMANW